MTIYPQMMPIGMQAKTLKAGVVMGPTHAFARAPLHLAFEAIRSADDIEALHRDADAIHQIFDTCPAHQIFCAAQAAMGFSAIASMREAGE